jgi:hemerythrin-like domain-containing protein
MKKITEVMCEEHRRIEKILEEFEKLVHIDFGSSKDAFNKFKWNLEKHLFVEEKVIFEVCNSDCGEEVSEIFDLMQEHGEIIGLIKEIEKKLFMNFKPNLSVMKELLEKHVYFEENRFYPMLDKELSTERKQEIFERAEEILRK